MSLGSKILEYRKKLNITQEQLAEELHVTRQTISKWELEETSPDIKQAKALSQVFQVSLDELTENEIQNLMVAQISNTEKLAGIVLKLMKFVGIFFLILLVIDIVSFLVFVFFR